MLYNIYEAFLEESKREEKAIKSNMRVLLCHMLKCKYQNDYSNKLSWRASIKNSFRNIIDEFDEKHNEFSGALYKKFYLKNFNLNRCYELAVFDAADETGLYDSDFQKECPWTKEQLIDSKFIREFLSTYGRDA